MASHPKPRLTLEEYLAAEQTSERRHEFWNGETFPVEAASEAHGQLCVQAGAALLRAASNECRVVDSSVCIYLESDKLAVYPDLTVVCGPSETVVVRGVPLAIRNPYLIVEVLSPSTQDYDRGAKATAYRSLPSLEHLLFISQDRVLIEHYERTGPDVWTIRTYRGMTDEIAVGSSPMRLSGIYERVEFTAQ